MNPRLIALAEQALSVLIKFAKVEVAVAVGKKRAVAKVHLDVLDKTKPVTHRVTGFVDLSKVIAFGL